MKLFALTALTMIAFAANSVLNRLALADTGMDPAAFSLIRLVSGAVALVALGLFRKTGRAANLGLRPMAAAMLALYVLGFSFAYATLDAGVGALILFGGVQITMFIGAVLLKERIPPARWIGAIVAFAGLIWLFWPGGRAQPDLAGALLMAAAALGWGIYSIKGRKQDDPIAATAANFLWSSPIALVAFFLFGHLKFPIGGVVYALLSGILTSGLGYALWYSVLPRIASSLAAVAQLTVPVIAMAGGVLFLDETMTSRFLVAAVLVLGGVGLSVLRSR